MMYRMGYLDYTPIRQIHFSTKQPERNRLFTALKTRYAIGPDEVTLNMVEDLLPKDLNGNCLAFQDGADWTYDPRTKMGKGICPEKSDVVHDFLSFLAEQMIVLNTQKQAEQKRFLGWLESKLSITEKGEMIGLEGLSGKPSSGVISGIIRKERTKRRSTILSACSTRTSDSSRQTSPTPGSSTSSRPSMRNRWLFSVP